MSQLWSCLHDIKNSQRASLAKAVARNFCIERLSIFVHPFGAC